MAALDLHCLQRQGISGFSRTRVNSLNIYANGFLGNILAAATTVNPSYNNLICA